MSPRTTRTRSARNDCSTSLLLTAWFSSDLVKHVLTSQGFCNALCLVFGQRMFRIGARNLENAIFKHHHTQRAEGHTRRDQDLIHIMDPETPRLFNPVFDEWVAQSVFSLR